MDARYLRAVADCLVFHNIIGSPSELTDANFKAKVRAFQTSHGGLFVDGDIGELTAWELQARMVTDGPQLMSVNVPVDSTPSVQSVPMNLRADAAGAAAQLFAAVRAKGGIVTSAGGIRPISTTPNAHQSARSMHYPGLAFDLAVATGGFDPDKDPFVLERTGTTSGPNYWRVWSRATGGIVRPSRQLCILAVGTISRFKPKRSPGNSSIFPTLPGRTAFNPSGRAQAIWRQRVSNT